MPAAVGDQCYGPRRKMTLCRRLLPFALGLWAVGVQLTELFAAIGAIATAVCVLVLKRPGKDDVKRWWPLAAFVLWGALIPLLTRLPTGFGLARLADWLLLPVAFAAVTRLDEKQLRNVALAAGITAALSCLCAGLQYFGLWPSEQAMGVLSFTKIPFQRVYEPVPGAEGRFMGGGLLFHRLRFAEVTGLVAIAAAAIAITRKQLQAAALAALGLIAVLVFPVARAAAAALVLSVAGMLKQRLIAAALILAAIVTVIAVPGLRERFSTSLTAKGSGERSGLLAAGLAAVSAHPLTGTGLGRYKPADYAAPQAATQVLEHGGKTHNQLVSLAAEGGIAHALLFLVLLVWLARALWKAPKSEARLAGLGALAFFVLLCGLHDPLFHAVFGEALVLVIGGALGLASATSPARPS